MPHAEHSQHHNHDHDHTHGSGHHHGPANYDRAFAWGIALNMAFVFVEGGFGLSAHSTALLADAIHNLSDVLGLLLAWGGSWLARKPRSDRFTYGLRASTIQAALTNAILLLLALGAIGWEAVQRLGNPVPVSGGVMTVVALVGVGINGATALLFMKGRKDDLNIQGAYLHMAADAAVSLGVVIAGVIISLTGWFWADPVVSLMIVAVILYGTWGLLRDAASLSLHAVPRDINVEKVRHYLTSQTDVVDIHDLHIWALSTTENALTAHLVMPGGYPGDNRLQAIAQELQHRYRIHHATLQVETGESCHGCAMDKTSSGS
jgi:cobalt-zinc-cadmium efflux system protein